MSNRSTTFALLASAAACLVILPASAGAQQRCSEGRTAAGKCVDPELAQDMRTRVVVFTQPKLSLTNPPNLPSQDGEYFVPRDHHEISNLHGNPAITSRFGPFITTSPGTPTSPIFLGPRP